MEEIQIKSAYLPTSFDCKDINGRPFKKLRFSDGQLLEAYETNDLVYTCVEKNATRVSSIAWGVYQIVKKKTDVTKGFRLTRKARKGIHYRKANDIAEDSDIVQLTDSPLIDVLSDANATVNGSQLIKLIQRWLEIFARAYLLIEQDGTLTPLKPWLVETVRDEKSGQVTHYKYNDNKNPEPFEADRVIAFRDIAASDPFAGGYSPTMAAISSVAVSDVYTQWLTATIAGRRRPDWVLVSTTGDATEDDIKRANLELKQKVKNGEPLVMSGNWKLVNLSYAPTDIAPLQVQQEYRKRVGSAYGIPTAILDSDAATYSNYETAMEDWDRTATLPRLNVIEQTINENLSKLGIDDDSIFFAFENPVAEDESADLESQKVAVTKIQFGGRDMTRNERRELLGLPPSGDPRDDELDAPTAAGQDGDTANADAAEAGDEPTTAPATADALTVNTEVNATASLNGAQIDSVLTILERVVLGSIASAAAVELIVGVGFPRDAAQGIVDAQSGVPKTALPEADAQTAKAIDRLRGLNDDVAEGRLPRAQAINIAEGLGYANAKQLIGYPLSQSCGCGKCETKQLAVTKQPAQSGEAATADKLQKVIAKYFKKLKPKVLSRMKGFDLTGYTIKDSLPDEFVPLDEWTEELANDVKPIIEFGTRKAADGKQEEYVRAGASPDAFTVMPQKIEDAADNRSYQFADSTIATTAKDINAAISAVREQILDGLAEGEGNEVLANRIAEIFENATDYQAERIARTEASATIHAGQVIAAKASGIVKGFEYLVSDDSCTICGEYVGRTIGIDDYDDSGKVDAEGAVPLHPNCTCTLTEIIDLGGDNNEGENDE